MITSGPCTVIGTVYSGWDRSIGSAVFLKFPSLSLETKVLSAGPGYDLDLGKEQYVAFPEIVTDLSYGSQTRLTCFTRKRSIDFTTSHFSSSFGCLFSSCICVEM